VSDDCWQAINRLASERHWYVFKNGESMYMADSCKPISRIRVWWWRFLLAIRQWG
jgi:hypothetical protein